MARKAIVAFVVHGVFVRDELGERLFKRESWAVDKRTHEPLDTPSIQWTDDEQYLDDKAAAALEKLVASKL